MLANFFGKSKPVNSIILIVVFLLQFLLAFFTSKIVFNWYLIPLFLILLGIVNFIVNKNELTFDNSYMFLFFILLIGLFPSVMNTGSTFFGNLLIILFFRKVYSLQSPNDSIKKIFDASFLLGVSFIVEPHSLIFLIALHASMYLFQKMILQHLIVSVIGIVAPLFLYFTYCFWYDKTELFKRLFFWFTDYNFSFYEHQNYLFSIGFLSAFLMASIFLKTPKALSVKNKFRQCWILVLIHLLLSIFLFLIVEDRNGNEFIYIIFPSAIILANGLETVQKKELISNTVIAFFFIVSFTLCIL